MRSRSPTAALNCASAKFAGTIWPPPGWSTENAWITSCAGPPPVDAGRFVASHVMPATTAIRNDAATASCDNVKVNVVCPSPLLRSSGRSEEHTSELQSQSNLVCRLLLEKKK